MSFFKNVSNKIKSLFSSKAKEENKKTTYTIGVYNDVKGEDLSCINNNDSCCQQDKQLEKTESCCNDQCCCQKDDEHFENIQSCCSNDSCCQQTSENPIQEKEQGCCGGQCSCDKNE